MSDKQACHATSSSHTTSDRSKPQNNGLFLFIHFLSVPSSSFLHYISLSCYSFSLSKMTQLVLIWTTTLLLLHMFPLYYCHCCFSPFSFSFLLFFHFWSRMRSTGPVHDLPSLDTLPWTLHGIHELFPHGNWCIGIGSWCHIEHSKFHGREICLQLFTCENDSHAWSSMRLLSHENPDT